MIGTSVKAEVWKVLARSYHATGWYRRRHRGTVSILMYHRVLPKWHAVEAAVQSGMYVTPETFERHLVFLKEHFEVLSLQELLEAWKGRTIAKSLAYCAFTFDDGWLDNYVHAYPLLKKYGVRATIFVPTDFIGTSRWFWPEQLTYLLDRIGSAAVPSERRKDAHRITAQYFGQETQNRFESACQANARERAFDRIIEQGKELPPDQIERYVQALGASLDVTWPSERLLMNWDEVRDMSQNGITFGSHSCSHRLLTKLSMWEVEEELSQSKATLERQQVRPVPVFCYPNGNYTPAIQRSVLANGYEAAVSCRVGCESAEPQDLLALKRIGLHNDASHTIPLLALALSGIR
jgi:peptidoglycan/xylan/chitin deacetylase (PgdA/CDA1 family)